MNNLKLCLIMQLITLDKIIVMVSLEPISNRRQEFWLSPPFIICLIIDSVEGVGLFAILHREA